MMRIEDDNALVKVYISENTKHDVIDYDFFRNLTGNHKLPRVVLKALRESIKVMNAVYQPEEWDLQVWPLGMDDGIELFPIFVIKFPEVTITNSKGGSNLLKDLYVGLPLFTNISDGVKKPHIDRSYGVRTTVSDAEYGGSYMHSHLRSIRKENGDMIRQFCIGSDSFSSTMILLNSEWKPELFQMLLHQLDDFVAWESLEGGPYNKIQNISLKNTKATLSLTIPEIEKIHQLIKSNLDVREFKIKIVEGRYTINDNEMFERALVRILPRQYLVRRGPDGNHYSITGVTQSQEFNQILHFVWKGERIRKMTIYPTLTDNEEDKVIHPHIKKLVIQRLEAKLTYKTYSNAQR